MIKFSAPGKIHLLGEHSVVYGKPAIIASIDLRVTVSITHPVIARSKATKQSFKEIATLPSVARNDELKNIIEPIVKKKFRIKKIPQYQVNISSKLPIGSGLGASAAISAAYIGALLTYLKIKWDKKLVNELTFEAEKVFHGNPSGGDNSTVVHGGLIWFRKETSDLRIIQPLDIKFSRSKNFVFIQTGTPKETTADMVKSVRQLYNKKSALVRKFLEEQENLVKQILSALKVGNETEMIRIIRAGERNLEDIGVTSPFVRSIIRKIEKVGGAAKICGAGASDGPTGILLCFHKDEHSSSANRKVVEGIAKSYNLPYFSVKLGVEGVRKET